MCRLTSSVCNSRQKWNENKWRYECKEDLIAKGLCYKRYIWNPSNCQCECDKSKKFLDYKNCVCRSSVIDKSLKECTVIDENKIYNETLNPIPSDDCASCTLYIALFVVFLTTSIIIGSSFIYFYWHKKK